MAATDGGGGGGAASSSGGMAYLGPAMFGMQLGASFSAASAATKMQKLQNKYAGQSARRARDLDQKILIRKAGETADAFGQQAFDREIAAMEMESMANVMAGEGGVSGISVQRIMDDINRQEGLQEVRQEKSFDSAMASIRDENEASIQNMINRYMGLPPVPANNYLATAINVAAPYVQSGAFENMFGGSDKGTT